MKNKLPNFLIVGAAKSGTSALHNYLNQHPKIFMPTFNTKGMKVKEPRFLIKDVVQNRLHNGVWSLEEYISLFKKADKSSVIGESSVLYLYYFDEAIKNIKLRLNDDVRIIIMLRNPVDRAFSAYTHVSRGLKENLSFEESLECESYRLNMDETLTPMVMYKDMGLYYKMVKAYMDNFEKVHIIIYDDFKNNTEKVVKETLCFLGVNENHEIDTSLKYNVGGRSWKSSLIKSLFMKDNLFKKKIRSILPVNFRKVVFLLFEYLFKQKSKPIKTNTKIYLLNYFRSDVEQLEALLKINLKFWKE